MGMGTFCRVPPTVVERGEVFRNECLNKCDDVISSFFRHAFVQAAHLIKQFIYGVLPIEQLPCPDAGGVQAETMTGITVKQNRPVVKLFPQYDPGVGYGFIIFVQGSTLILFNSNCPGRKT